MSAMASQITSLMIVYSTAYSGANRRSIKLRVTGLCVGNSPHKWPVTRKMFPFDDVIMELKWTLHMMWWTCTEHSLESYIKTCPPRFVAYSKLHLYRQSQCLITWDSKCLALIAHAVKAFDMNPKVGGSGTPQVETFSPQSQSGCQHGVILVDKSSWFDQ